MIGQDLLHYRILGKLGKGNAGQVYRAEDTRLRRRVALKIVRDLHDDPQRAERFRREAWALASVNHPNVVTLYSVEEKDGLDFLTMELVEGNTLDALVVPGGIDLETFRDLAIPLLRGLRAAHRKEIVHRDLKPQNIKITPDEELKILDFGLATQPKGGAGLEESLHGSDSENIVGTVPYMAPETLHGRKGDARVDVFAVGVIFFELLTGLRPFSGSSPMAVAAAILREPTPSLRARRPDVAPELERVILRCMEKDPEQRYADAEDLIRSLAALKDWPSQTAVSGDFAALLRPTEEIEMVPSPPQHRLGLVFAAAIFLVALILIRQIERINNASPGSASIEQTQRKMLVVLPFENLGRTEDGFFAQGVSDEITSRLTGVAGLGVISRTSAARYAETEKSLAQISEELNVDFVLSGTVRWDHDSEPKRVLINPRLTRTSDEIEVWATQYERSLTDIFALQTSLAEDVVDRLGTGLLDPEDEAPTESVEAYQAFLKGRQLQNSPQLTQEVRERAVDYFRRAADLDPDYAEAWAALASAHAFAIHLGIDASEERVRETETALAKAKELAPRHPAIRIAAANVHYRAFKDYDRAMEELTHLGDGNAESLTLQGLIVRRQGRFEESLGFLRRAEVLDPRNAFLMNEIGSNCFLLRRDPCARSAFRQAITLDPEVSTTYFTYILHLWNQGDLAEARRYLESLPSSGEPLDRYFTFWQSVYEGDLDAAVRHVETSETLWLRTFFFATPASLLEAQAYDLQGSVQAVAAYRRAAQEILYALKERPDDSMLYASLGLAQAGLGEHDAAIRSGLSAVQLMPISRDAVYGPIRVADLALIYARTGEIEAARDQINVLLSMPSILTEEILDLDPRWEAVRSAL